MASPELVIFAIKAGIKLAQEARHQYVMRTKDLGLILPLPTLVAELKPEQAVRYFDKPAQAIHFERFQGLKKLHGQAKSAGGLGGKEAKRYLAIYREARAIEAAEAMGVPVALNGEQMPVDAYISLVSFRQWNEDDPSRPKLERRLIGLIVEIGVDYVATVPGTFDTTSRHGQVIAGFVQAVNRIQFEELAVQEKPLEKLFGKLLVAALETVGEQAELVVSDKRVQELVGVAAKGLSVDIAAQLEQAGDTSRRAQLSDWAELVFRSLISSAGRKVLAEPAKFLGVDELPEGKLITGVGHAAIELLIKDESVDVRRVFGREGLNTLIDAALETVAAHPELITRETKKVSNGLNGLISAIAIELKKHEGLLTPDALPQVTRMLLEQTGKRLDEIFPDFDKPEEHLLLTAVGKTLEVLAEPSGDSEWRPGFGKGDALIVLETVVEELAANPAWLIQAGEDIDANLGAALASALEVIRRRAGKWLSLDTAAEVLSASVKAIALRQEFLDEVADAKPLIAAVIDVVFQQLFEPGITSQARWQLLRDEAIVAAVGISLDRMAGSTMDAAALGELKAEVQKQFKLVADGGRVEWERFDRSLELALPQPR